MTLKFAALLIAAVVACAAPARCEDVPNYSHPPYQHPFEATLRAAEHGDVVAQVQVGRDYEKAFGVEQNLERAVDWYQEAAAAGSPQAMLALGLLGQHVNLADDEKKAVGFWLLRAAETGIAAAQVAEAKFHGKYLEKKAELKWLERAVAQEDLEAKSVLGPMLLAGDNPNQWSRGEQYVIAAEKAYPRTRFYTEIAKFLRQHKGPEIKIAKIPEELRRAALSMDIEEEDGLAIFAAMSIAGIFDFNDPVALQEGMRKHLEQAVHDGDLQSACNLAFLNSGAVLQFGEVFSAKTRENYKEAFNLYLSAAKQGAPRAQYHLGKIYRDGLGTDANSSEAAKWFYQAAMHGYPPAEAALGDLLLHGNGVTTDYAAALGWLRPAAAYGNPMARFDFGTMYLNGLGVEKDTKEAIMLIDAASIWPAAADWLQQAQSDPAMSRQIADTVIRNFVNVRYVDSGEGGCDEPSINSKVEE
jgi:uncharacterized protein